MKGMTILEQKVDASLKEYAQSICARKKVVGCFDNVASVTADIPLANLDYWERTIRYSFNKALRDEPSSLMKLWENYFPLITWVDLCSWDGHRREKALRTLGDSAPNKFFLALVLRRLNDWVPQVRQAAEQSLPKLLLGSNPDVVAEVVCFTLTHWSTWIRIEASARSAVLNAVSKPDVLTAIKRRLLTSAQGPLCTILNELSRCEVMDSDLFDIAQLAIQPSLRAKALRMLFDSKASWCSGKKWVYTDKVYGGGKYVPVVDSRAFVHDYRTEFLIKVSAKDPSSIVRRVGAEILIREMDNGIEDPRTFADIFAQDPSLAVSERGRFAQRKLTISV